MVENNEILIALKQIEKDKKLKKEDVLVTIENALISAYKKHVGKNVKIDAKIDPDNGSVITNVIKTVVKNNYLNSLLEINIYDARKIDNNVRIGDEIKIPVNHRNFARVAAQTARQIIIQKIKESEKNILFIEMKKKIGQIVNGIVYKITNGNNIIVDLGKTDALLPVGEQVAKEKFSVGQHIKAIILRVEKKSRGPEIILSRASPRFVRKLFELEVPEIYEKIVEIVNIVRENGVRTKISVLSHNHKVDPVGACVGVKGARVKPIIDELRGEKIDLISYSVDPIKYISNSLSPAKINSGI
ncbi:MAG: transcription termination factor NusA, partial [Endomicrobium sp.]|nr:transcription termination factor NusA [Endomicrobium sp.]